MLGNGGDLPGCSAERALVPRGLRRPHGYTELLQALADPRHPEHGAMSAWVGARMRPFDQEVHHTAASGRGRRRARERPTPARPSCRRRQADPRWPTAARRGPRSPGPATRLVPAGAACLDRGRPLPAGRPPRHPAPRPAPPAGQRSPADHQGRWQRARDRTPTSVLVRTTGVFDHARRARGRPPRNPRTDPGPAARNRGLRSLGHGWQRGDQQITAHDVERELHHLSDQLQALDLITTNRSSWSADRRRGRFFLERRCSPDLM